VTAHAPAELNDVNLDELAATIAARLSPWFERHKRDLEWRGTRDPYAIWISEIMLQQTRVETVRDYYSRFLARFPDVATLAAADQEDVLEAWSGLGYYRRARLLHRGARYVLNEHAGELPQRAADLRAVPGVGPYTAGAIASIAFDRPVALVDGNVARVISRLLAIAAPERQLATAKVHWVVAQAVLERGSPRVLAQALMELGATVCTPRQPRCAACPLRASCLADARGLSEQIPAVRRKIAQPVEELWAAAILWRGRLLLERRPETGLLAGMWCLPLLPRTSAAADTPRAPSPKEIKATHRLRVQKPEPVPKIIKHVFTHRIWKLRACRLAALGRARATLDETRYAWVQAGERPAGGLPKVTQKLLAHLDR
jgi:A/G-specific adenine glycosylase